MPKPELHFHVVTFVKDTEDLPAYVSRVRFAVHQEPAEQDKWGGCTGCVGVASSALCLTLKQHAPVDCATHGVIYKPDLELH